MPPTQRAGQIGSEKVFHVPRKKQPKTDQLNSKKKYSSQNETQPKTPNEIIQGKLAKSPRGGGVYISPFLLRLAQMKPHAIL